MHNIIMRYASMHGSGDTPDTVIHTYRHVCG